MWTECQSRQVGIGLVSTSPPVPLSVNGEGVACQRRDEGEVDLVIYPIWSTGVILR